MGKELASWFGRHGPEPADTPRVKVICYNPDGSVMFKADRPGNLATFNAAIHQYEREYDLHHRGQTFANLVYPVTTIQGVLITLE
jgi:hypothetical protein